MASGRSALHQSHTALAVAASAITLLVATKRAKPKRPARSPKNEGHKMDGGPSCSSQLHRILWHYFAAYVEHCFPERLRWRRLNSSTARYSHVPVINWLLAAHAIIEPSEMKSITRLDSGSHFVRAPQLPGAAKFWQHVQGEENKWNPRASRAKSAKTVFVLRATRAPLTLSESRLFVDLGNQDLPVRDLQNLRWTTRGSARKVSG